MAKKLYLSNNRKLGGVCAGIAEYFGIDPTVVRLLWVLTFFAYGIGFLSYFICWLIIPKSPYAN
ncbi:MAG: PspC domain-containing protein [Firmicutes bacterium]|nr:PspC domain-containing protein [Bacillota bacterium]